MLPTYAMITPARNEEEFIEMTLKSVISQTVLPAKWIIVSDGSTDRTEDIVRGYAKSNPWIELVKMPDRDGRDFAGKVHAFNAGYRLVDKSNVDVIVSLDADISFEQDYFSYLLSKLQEDPALGLVGTPFCEQSGQVYDYRFVSIEHVSGACQVFRRECFSAIGGYRPVKGGLIDRIAVISARMKGWKTRTFTERSCVHHRAVGTAQNGPLAARFKDGVKDYAIGNHPAWEFFRGVYQITRKPFLVGAMAMMSGYMWSAVRNAQRPVPAELVAFHRQEQMHRLRQLLAKRPQLHCEVSGQESAARKSS